MNDIILTLLSRKIPAFILNLEQHWFTLRRFGDASPLIEVDEGNGLWFNLNSFLPSPEWLSKTYLGMVIQQAEAEGYPRLERLWPETAVTPSVMAGASHKLGRNEPCWCGSGLKYKQCHLDADRGLLH